MRAKVKDALHPALDSIEVPDNDGCGVKMSGLWDNMMQGRCNWRRVSVTGAIRKSQAPTAAEVQSIINISGWTPLDNALEGQLGTSNCLTGPHFEKLSKVLIFERDDHLQQFSDRFAEKVRCCLPEELALNKVGVGVRGAMPCPSVGPVNS